MHGALAERLISPSPQDTVVLGHAFHHKPFARGLVKHTLWCARTGYHQRSSPWRCIYSYPPHQSLVERKKEAKGRAEHDRACGGHLRCRSHPLFGITHYIICHRVRVNTTRGHPTTPPTRDGLDEGREWWMASERRGAGRRMTTRT
jgi:hypothetical protein